jgi:4,5-DOPA dioxygenase extradiol
MTAMPSIFVSHGAPNLVLYDTPARRFLAEYARNIERPTAILSVSAHFETDRPAVVADPAPEMIYDFGGFEDELYTLTYPAPGDPALAERVAGLLAEAGLGPAVVQKRGYDHGTWVPMMLLFPDADIPVAQLSVQPGASAEHHYRLGEAIAPLREEGVLIVGSGSFTHNLYEAFQNLRRGAVDADRPEWVESFVDWMVGHLEAGDVDDLLDYRAKAPYAAENHPTDEHLMPLYVALGAAGQDVKAQRVHESHQFGALELDAFAFN